MNIQGIKLLRKFSLPGPRTELFFNDVNELDLDSFYHEADKGATIIVFDKTEEINQNPLLEKNVRKYNVKREDFLIVLKELIEKIKVKEENLTFYCHQSYIPEDISFSGRAAILNREFIIDAVKGLRKAESDFTPDFIIKINLETNKQEIIEKEIDFPIKYINQILEDIKKLPKTPYVDFEIYKDNGELFYHDLFLADY